MKSWIAASVPLAAGLAVLSACGGNDDDIVPVVGLNCDAVAGLDSYHYDAFARIAVTKPEGGATPTASSDPPALSLSWESAVDVVEAGGRLQAGVNVFDGPGESRTNIIAVGQDVWQQVEPAGFIKLTRGSPPPLSYPPADICKGLQDDLVFSSMTGTAEKVDGVKSVKFTLTDLPPSVFSGIRGLGGGDIGTVLESYNGEIWVTEDGYPIKADLSGSGQYDGGSTLSVELQFEYSAINDVDTEIVAPVPR